MTINVQIRKDATVTVPASVLLAVLAAREDGEEINVTVYPGGTVLVTAPPE